MKKTTILFLAFCLSFTINAQVCQPSVPTSGMGSHNLTIASSDADFIIGPGACVDLTANFSEVGETDVYGVRSIPFNPPFNFNGLQNQIFLNTDDLWTDIISLPFDFCFFEDSNSELILGSNGVLSFQTEFAATGNGWAFSESLPNNANPTLGEANIFGAGHDMDPAASGGLHEIGWEVRGVAPFRAFVFSYFNVAHFSGGCNALKTFQMVVFYESTNTIEVYILDKPTCFSWNNGNAVIGIQNDAGTIAYTPPDRNTGNWTASVEAWQFYPNGTPIYDFTWYDGATAIGTDLNVNVCPTETTTYTAELTYTNPVCGVVSTVTRCVTITVDPELSVESNVLEALTVYPNPTKDVLYVKTSLTIDKINVYNLLGQEVVNFNKNSITNNSISLSNMSKGLYFVDVVSNNKMKTFKIIKE